MTLSVTEITKPMATDGMAMNRLVASCSPLDTNSVYCNLLQAGHFSDTSVVAKSGENLLGFVSGYVIPNKTNSLFIWQVAIDEQARGQGLAKKMLTSLLERSACSDAGYIETSITRSNAASWALFRSLAKQLDAPLEESILFDEHTHFQGKHDTEYLVRIGPF